MVTHQLQVERRTGKVRRPETDVLPRSSVGAVACRERRRPGRGPPLSDDGRRSVARAAALPCRSSHGAPCISYAINLIARSMGRSYGARARARERERDRVCRDRFVTVVYRAVPRLAVRLGSGPESCRAGRGAPDHRRRRASPFLSHAKLSDTEIWRAGWQWPRRLYILCWSELSRRRPRLLLLS